MKKQSTMVTATAKLFRWSSLKKGWEEKYVVETTDETISQNIIRALTVNPIKEFYKWDCYNSAGIFQGSIFTANTNLF